MPNGPDPSAGTSVSSAGTSQPGPPDPPGPLPPGGRQLPGRWRLAAAAVITAAAALIAYVVVSSQHHGTTPAAAGAPGRTSPPPARSNPGVDPGTPLAGRPAPGFTLTDQFGKRVSLSQFRGKAVVMTFVDSECTTVCPLGTESLTGAVSLLGPGAASHIQLLGVDANPSATAVADVRAYSASHAMMHSWHFLTGTKAQLEAVWRAYHVYVAASSNDIDHEPAIYLIDPQGRERVLYLTQMSYTSVGQQAQIIADGLSTVLPGHPQPRRVVPLSYIRGVSPRTAMSAPGIGGSTPSGQVALGPGHPHVLVFAARWLGQTTDLRAGLRGLTAYQQLAARRGLPSPVVVDVVPAESSGSALPQLLAGLGGAPLGYPVVADTTGRLAAGYGVQDMPWLVVTGQDGRVLAHHLGWLSAPELARFAAGAQR
jgi:cytochrome oxidase Cu insertion factor (SCO1/SenC/PrrC family)